VQDAPRTYKYLFMVVNICQRHI